MSGSFDKLEEILEFHDLKIVANVTELEDFNYLELCFYYKSEVINADEDFEFAGRMNYDIISNDLDIDWEGEAPELIVMAIDSYIQESYNKIPDKYFINSLGLQEHFKLRKD